MKKIKTGYIMLAIVGLFLLFSPNSKLDDSQADIIQGGWDISEEVAAKGYDIYLVEESDFDYSDEEVYSLATEIKSSTSTPEESVKKTIRWVARNIAYSPKISVDYCYNEKASTVLEVGYGDCVSMSRVVVSLLRAQGIPARTKGGCLSQNLRCTALFSLVSGLEAQTTEMIDGDFKKRGFLHEFVEYYNVEKDAWFLIESTSGQTFPTNCIAYKSFSYDTNQYNRCIINSQTFFNECRVY